MPALSKKQQKFMGIVRSIQKGEQPASKFNKDAQDVAKDMKKTDVKKFASTKHKGLPMKKEILGKLKEMIKQELSEYTYGSGDIVKDVNPTCPHYGAQGKVKSVNPKSVVFVVMNKGKNFKPGMELEKSHDQMKKIGESVNEAKYKVHMRDKKRGNFELEKFQTGGQSYDYKKGMDIVKKLRKMSGSLEYKLVKESINENRDFEKLYNLFTKKDYFNLKNSIKTMLRNWETALKKGDKGAQKYKKQDIIKAVTIQNKANAKRVYDELVTAIKKKDIRRLKSRLRYNQPYSIAIFNQTTGKKLPKNTRDIQSFLDNEFMKESVNEARLNPKQTIQQLGGDRFLYMVGAKNLAIDKPRNELHMKIMRNAKGVSHVVIKLTSLDLYDMKFLSIRAGKIRVKAKEKGVYGDQLATFFKKHTGLNTRL